MITTHLLRPEEIIIEEVEQPVPERHEVLVKVHNVGICGSDIHAYYGKHPFIKLPIIQGHEFSGEAAGLGAEAEGVTVGERVTVVPMLHCRLCYNCRQGQYNRCPELKFIGCQTTGAMAEYVVVPDDKIVPLPEVIDYETGALIEPLAVGVHGAAIGSIGKGDNVIIIGSGTIGLMTMLSARAMGANALLLTDIDDKKLTLAKSLGADFVCNVSRNEWQKVMEHSFGSEGANVIFECVGTPQTIREAIHYAPIGCRIVVIGVFSEDVPLNIGYIQDHELEVLGIAGYTIRDFKKAVQLIVENEISIHRLKKLIMERFPLKKIKEAYKYIEQNQPSVLKVMLEV